MNGGVAVAFLDVDAVRSESRCMIPGCNDTTAGRIEDAPFSAGAVP